MPGKDDRMLRKSAMVLALAAAGPWPTYPVRVGAAAV
jgi:hypothetical protein